jgi:hypothetical protein
VDDAHIEEFLVGRLTAEHREIASNEFGSVLRRGTVELPPEAAVERFRRTWTAWRRDRADVVARIALPAGEVAVEVPVEVPVPGARTAVRQLVRMLVRRTIANARRTIQSSR